MKRRVLLPLLGDKKGRPKEKRKKERGKKKQKKKFLNVRRKHQDESTFKSA